MPIYEYKCVACGHTFEVITGFSKNGTRKCEKCGAPAKRLISPAGIVFRGSGFHVTDYKKSQGGVDGPQAGSKGKDITPKRKAGETPSEGSD